MNIDHIYGNNARRARGLSSKHGTKTLGIILLVADKKGGGPLRQGRTLQRSCRPDNDQN